ncbi:MAG: hypothetical protein ACK6D3_04470 [Planctomycetaceae bacterium]|jgi:hypothetical protein
MKNRLLRAILFWIGIVFTAVGVLALIVLTDRNWNQNLSWLVGFAGLLVSGLVLAFLFRKALSAETESETPQRTGRYLIDQAEPLAGLPFPAEVHFEQEVQGRNPRPASLKVRLHCTLPGELNCRPETRFDRFAKAIGLAVEPQTGDADFDQSNYLRTDRPDFAGAMLGDATRRDAIRLLRSLGYQELTIGPDQVQAVWTGFDPLKDDRANLAQQTAQLLVPLASLPVGSGEFDAEPDGRIQVALEWLMWGLSVAFALLAILGWLYEPLRFWQFAKVSAAVWAVLLPLAAGVGYAVMRGDSRSHDRWRSWLLPTLLFTALGSLGSVAGLNALADQTPPETRQLPIQNVREVRGRRSSKSYYGYVADWDNPAETREFRLSRDEFEQARRGKSQLEITTSQGALGLRWIHHRRFIP